MGTCRVALREATLHALLALAPNAMCILVAAAAAVNTHREHAATAEKRVAHIQTRSSVCKALNCVW